MCRGDAGGLSMLGKLSTTELQLQPLKYVTNHFFFFVVRFSILDLGIKSGMEILGIEDSKLISLLVLPVILSLFLMEVLTIQQYMPTWLEIRTLEDSLLCFHTHHQLPSVVLHQWPTS